MISTTARGRKMERSVFVCEVCELQFEFFSKYKRHLATNKHLMMEKFSIAMSSMNENSDDEEVTEVRTEWACDEAVGHK